jgi:hypothetical protein
MLLVAFAAAVISRWRSGAWRIYRGGGATSVEPRMEPTVDDVRLLPERQETRA